MISDRTAAEYQREWTRFIHWTEERGASPLPAAPDLVAAYLSEMVSSDPAPSLSTLRRIKAAIDHKHVEAGHAKPSRSAEVVQTWDSIRRRQTKGRWVTGEVNLDEVLTPTQRAMITAQPATALGVRDRAILLIGIGAGLRPAEVVGLSTEDVRVESLIKSDKRGGVFRVESLGVSLPDGGVVRPFSSTPGLDPVKHAMEWAHVAGLDAGHEESGKRSGQILFRGVDRHGNVSDKGLTLAGLGVVTRRAAELAGLEDPGSYTPSMVFTERLDEGSDVRKT